MRHHPVRPPAVPHRSHAITLPRVDGVNARQYVHGQTWVPLANRVRVILRNRRPASRHARVRIPHPPPESPGNRMVPGLSRCPPPYRSRPHSPALCSRQLAPLAPARTLCSPLRRLQGEHTVRRRAVGASTCEAEQRVPARARAGTGCVRSTGVVPRSFTGSVPVPSQGQWVT